MGFNDYHNKTPNPAQVFYRWSGGLKDVELPDGTTAKQLKGELKYWDGEASQSAELPITLCVLEQTRCITGFAPNGNSSVRFYSNEAVDNNDVLVVHRASDDGSEEIIRGQYQKIKTQLPQGARLCVRLYCYNPQNKQIECVNLQGSSLSAFIEYSRKNKQIYERFMTIAAGEKTKTGSVEFIPPMFTAGERYSDSQMTKLREQDDILLEYLKYIKQRNGGESEDGTSQEPALYDGEGSQETQDNETIIMTDSIPTPEEIDALGSGDISPEDIPF